MIERIIIELLKRIIKPISIKLIMIRFTHSSRHVINLTL